MQEPRTPDYTIYEDDPALLYREECAQKAKETLDYLNAHPLKDTNILRCINHTLWCEVIGEHLTSKDKHHLAQTSKYMHSMFYQHAQKPAITKRLLKSLETHNYHLAQTIIKGASQDIKDIYFDKVCGHYIKTKNYRSNKNDLLRHAVVSNQPVRTIKPVIATYRLSHLVDDGYHESFLLAIVNGFTDVARCLIECGADVNVKSNALHYQVKFQRVIHHAHFPVCIAVVYGRCDIVRLLIAEIPQKVPVNSEIYSCPLLSLAAIYNQTDVARLLLSNGAAIDAVDADDMSALSYANKHGSFDVFHLLLLHGAKIDNEKTLFCVIRIAAEKGDDGSLKIARHIMQTNQINLQPIYDECVHQVVKNNRVSLMAFFVEHKVDLKPNELNAQIGSLLLYASERGYVEIAASLIDQGADVNVHDSEHLPPLIAAIQGNHFPIVELLVNKRANVNFFSEKIRPPLWHAMIYNQFNTIVCLIVTGKADVNLLYAYNEKEDEKEELTIIGYIDKYRRDKRDGIIYRYLAGCPAKSKIESEPAKSRDCTIS